MERNFNTGYKSDYLKEKNFNTGYPVLKFLSIR
jgi:hypothetical protein